MHIKNKKKIWLSTPHMCGVEQKYIQEAFDSNWIAPVGANLDCFEKDIINYTGVKSATALSSGTAAIHLALIILGIKSNDEVLCSSFTFSASANPILYQGAIPVFVDSEIDTWNMCPILLEKAITARIAKGKKPKAIILVHLYGMPAKMDEILAISAKFKIPIIEDAAEAVGSTFQGKALGTLGDIGIYSFNGNKIITTSGGGALVSNEKKYCDKALFLATQARDKAAHYQHSEIGYNYRMSNILAGIGRGQMEVLDNRIAARRTNFEFYKANLASTDIKFLQEPAGYFSNRWLTCIITKSFNQRENIRLRLEKENIEARPLWKPMHQQPVFKNYPKYVNGIAEDMFEKGLCLPSGSNLSEDDLNRVVSAIKS
jgi:dTDP-4-amino-4,6-dideoxygalactose transaminase